MTDLDTSGRASSSARWMALILGLAVGLRLALGLSHVFWFPDSRDYDLLARALMSGRDYQVGGLVASRMPGYPIFLAGVYELFGVSSQAVVVVQAILGGMTVWMVYVLGRRAGETVGVAAAALAAVDPLCIGFSAAILSETPFTLMLLVAVWICLRIGEGAGWYRWSVLGVVWVIAVYLRAEVLWCLLPLGVAVCLMKRGARLKWMSVVGLVWAVGIVLIWLAPWQMRNYEMFHAGYFRMTTLEGISLYEAVYDKADGGPRQDKPELIARAAEMKGLDEAQRNDEWSRRAWGEIAGHPARTLGLAVRKVGRTWSPLLNAGEFQRAAVQVMMGLWHIPLFILAAIGLWAQIMPLKVKCLLMVPVAYFTAVHALFLGSVRYRVPLMPLVCVFAACGIVYLWQRMRDQRGGARTV